MNEYEATRRVVYDQQAMFVPVCEFCGRFVKADSEVRMNGRGLIDEPNATCSKCGRTRMLFEGFVP